jgi:hypothetical protein
MALDILLGISLAVFIICCVVMVLSCLDKASEKAGFRAVVMLNVSVITILSIVLPF